MLTWETSRMPLMPPTDSMFLLAESRSQPMHVGGLQLFEPPDGAGPDYLRTSYEQLLTHADVAPAFRRRPCRSLSTLGQWEWVDDPDIDLEHHIRHSALPRPGRIRELLALTSRLHGTLLDRQRPLWEAHLIEGLADGRFAVYTKLHHAVMDGVSALRLLESSLSPDPDARDVPAPWAPRGEQGRSRRSSEGLLGGVAGLPGAAVRAASDVVGLSRPVLRVAREALSEHRATLPGPPPRTMLNVPVTGSRRFAAQSWSLELIRGIARAGEATVNDVYLAACAGALRRYLLDQEALPDAPLIAMVPMSLRQDGAGEAAGNAVGTILVNLGTHLTDPAERFESVRASTRQAKAILAGLSPVQVLALSGLVMSPLALTPLPYGSRLLPAPFNLVISNVPGPHHPVYWSGARLDGVYPLSIPLDGQALNITATSYDNHLDIGLVGCRRSVPHLQRLLAHLDASFEELAKLTGT